MADLLSSLPPEFLANYPALQPPHGVDPNFVNPVSRGYVLLTAGSLLFALMILFLSIRIYIRFFVSRQFSWADVTCITGALGASAYFINQIIAVKYASLGKHLWDVPIGQLNDTFCITNAFLSVILVNPTLMATKLTLFQLYLELFHPFRWMRISVWIGITITTVFYVAASITQIVLTIPRKGESWLLHANSHAERAAQMNGIPFAAVGLVIDVYLLILPIKAVMDLQLPLKRKIGVGMVFLTGLLACLASSLSIWLRVGYNKSSDLTWSIVDVILTALVEMNVGVMIACTPAVSKLFLHHSIQFKFPQLSFRGYHFGSGANSKFSTGSDASTQPKSYGQLSQTRVSQTNHENNHDQGSVPLTKGYFRINGAAEQYEMDGRRTISTDIETGDVPRNDVSNHQIHLKREVWQSV